MVSRSNANGVTDFSIQFTYFLYILVATFKIGPAILFRLCSDRLPTQALEFGNYRYGLLRWRTTVCTWMINHCSVLVEKKAWWSLHQPGDSEKVTEFPRSMCSQPIKCPKTILVPGSHCEECTLWAQKIINTGCTSESSRDMGETMEENCTHMTG